MKINEIITKTKKTGAGTVTTVGGNEISRSTPKIGGLQTTQYADGSIKSTFNTNAGGSSVDVTKVNGINTNLDVASGNLALKTTNTGNNKYKLNKAAYNMGGGQGTLVAQPGKLSIKK
tara:strand:- start:584 stop:937 length:354 start_codon:yes stop_codon:yes gene_type:complete